MGLLLGCPSHLLLCINHTSNTTFIEHFQSIKLDFHRSKRFLYHTLVFPTHAIFNLKCKCTGKYIWHRFGICIWPLKLNDVTGRHWKVWVNSTQTTGGGPRIRVKVFGRGSRRPLLVTPVTCMEGEWGRVHCIKLYVFVRVRHTMTGIPLLWCLRPLRVPPGKFGENHWACLPHLLFFRWEARWPVRSTSFPLLLPSWGKPHPGPPYWVLGGTVCPFLVSVTSHFGPKPMSANMAAVSNKGDILAFIFALCIIFKLLRTWVGKKEGCYMKGSPWRLQHHGSVWPCEHLWIIDPRWTIC